MNGKIKFSDSSRRALNDAGMKFTSQRALVLDIIRRGQGHLDAEEVHRRAQKKYPRLSLSTVYRTLHIFKEQGLVEELHFDEEHHHYEVKPSVEHHHLRCLGCGRVVEFTCPLAEKMRKDISRETGFEITSAEVQMTGYCPDCRQHRK
ncbi:Fur family transcriptional regulator [Chloroflexota bacterium]